MKIGIFTLRSIDPLHPRLAAFIEYFNERKIACEIIPGKTHFLFSRLNWISLFFFDNWSVFVNRNKPMHYDIVLINDLKLLPLAKLAKGYGKTVIYDTIDNNVALRGYSLQKKIPVMKPLMKLITAHFEKKEKKLADKYCDKITVNSKALMNYFNNKAVLLFYYSFFGEKLYNNNSHNNLSLLYLGDFSPEKGSVEVLELRKKLDTRLFIFGSVSEEMRNSIDGSSVIHFNKMPSEELRLKIGEIMNTDFLAGTSFIKSVHLSYATQEANKDIDYLAIGAPIIGNHREPTAEKIKAECGVFGDKENDLLRLKTDQKLREKLSSNCRNYYMEYYSRKSFIRSLDGIFENS